MMNQKGRDKTIDIMRGISIIVMIMGHIGIGIASHDKNFSTWYHAWHMPVFYIVSGFFFSRTYDMDSFVKKKSKNLLLPFFFFGVLNIVLNYFNDGNSKNATQAVIGALFRKPTDAGIYCAGALWFLPALFWSEMIYKVLTQIVKNNTLFYISTCLIGVGGVIAEKHNIFLPFALDAALVAIPFVALGELLKICRQTKYARKIFHTPWYLFCGLLIFTTLLIFYNGEVNFRTGVYGNEIIAFINASLATILLWNISRIISNKFTKNLLKTISDVLASIGRNSIIYLCLNQRIIYFVKPIISNYFNGTIIKCYIGMICTLVVVIFVCHILMKIFDGNNKLQCFVGK